MNFIKPEQKKKKSYLDSPPPPRKLDFFKIGPGLKIPYLKFGGYEHGGGADELQHLPVDWSLGQVVVCHLHGQVQGLVVQLKVLLNGQTEAGQHAAQTQKKEDENRRSSMARSAVI